MMSPKQPETPKSANDLYEGPRAWREILEQGWGSYYCASSCLEAVRLVQAVSGDITKPANPEFTTRLCSIARWNYNQLIDMVSRRWEGAYYTLQTLQNILGPSGMLLLQKPTEKTDG